MDYSSPSSRVLVRRVCWDASYSENHCLITEMSGREEVIP